MNNTPQPQNDQSTLTCDDASAPVPSDLDKARSFLADAEDQLAMAFGRNVPPAVLATACAAIGGGYAQLAAAEVITAEPQPLLVRQTGALPAGYVEGLERAMQALEEAPPGDVEAAAAPEPVPAVAKPSASAKPRRSTRG